MEPKRFYRSTTDKKIAGVAGGLGIYFEIDPLLVRLLFVILSLAGGGGVLIYLILWLVTPERPREFQHSNTYTEPEAQPEQPINNPQSSPDDVQSHGRRRGNLIGALVLITLGVLFLVDEFIDNIDFGDLWPILLIVIGIGLLVNSFGRRRL